eukprot:1157596-Pelagomonas_calceolata.AAC.7
MSKHVPLAPWSSICCMCHDQAASCLMTKIPRASSSSILNDQAGPWPQLVDVQDKGKGKVRKHNCAAQSLGVVAVVRTTTSDALSGRVIAINEFTVFALGAGGSQGGSGSSSFGGGGMYQHVISDVRHILQQLWLPFVAHQHVGCDSTSTHCAC